MSATGAKTCGAVSVTTSSTAILAANTSRRSVTIVNDGSNVVYLAVTTSFGTAPTAVANSGVRLNASGGSWYQEDFSGAVAGIAVGGTSVVTVLET